jgi:hypothetical protein
MRRLRRAAPFSRTKIRIAYMPMSAAIDLSPRDDAEKPQRAKPAMVYASHYPRPPSD